MKYDFKICVIWKNIFEMKFHIKIIRILLFHLQGENILYIHDIIKIMLRFHEYII